MWPSRSFNRFDMDDPITFIATISRHTPEPGRRMAPGRRMEPGRRMAPGPDGSSPDRPREKVGDVQ